MLWTLSMVMDHFGEPVHRGLPVTRVVQLAKAKHGEHYSVRFLATRLGEWRAGEGGPHHGVGGQQGSVVRPCSEEEIAAVEELTGAMARLGEGELVMEMGFSWVGGPFYMLGRWDERAGEVGWWLAVVESLKLQCTYYLEQDGHLGRGKQGVSAGKRNGGGAGGEPAARIGVGGWNWGRRQWVELGCIGPQRLS
jgi:hypothetical protein